MKNAINVCGGGKVDPWPYNIWLEGKGMKETIEQAKDDMGLGASHLGTANGKMNICRYFIEELGFVPDLRFRL